MKNTQIITFILCTLLILNSASAYTEDTSKYDITCLDNGAIRIISPDIINDVSGRPETIVSAKKTGGDTIINIPGTWKDGYFTSEELLLNETGEYNITINIYSELEVHKTVTCPGLVFSCEIYSISISRCYKEGNTLYAFFETKNTGKYDLDPKKNMTYSMTTGKAYTIEISQKKNNHYLDKLETFYMGEGKYKLKWLINENIEIFHIRTPLCRAYASKKCNEPQKCEKDTECFDFEYCDTYCKKLNCAQDEQILNHKCISCATDSDCDDTLICTEDKCINNECVHESIQCRSPDECTTAKCVEPKGCVYTTDENCKKSRHETAQPKTEEPQKSNESSNAYYAGVALILAVILILIYNSKNKPEKKIQDKPKKKTRKPQKKNKQKKK